MDVQSDFSEKCIKDRTSNTSRYIKLDSAVSSKGDQEKYYDTQLNKYIKLQFYYQDKYWNDHMCESLSYKLYTMLNNSHPVLKQDVMKSDIGIYCVVSDNFCNDHEESIKFSRIPEIYELHKYKEKPYRMFTEMLSIFRNIYNVDIESYLVTMIVMDYLLGNEDRHWNNMDVIRDDNVLKPSVLYDFGLSLFEHDRRYVNMDLDTAISNMGGKPFSVDLSNPVKMLLNTGYESRVLNMVKDVEVPDRDLFPNKLGFNYFKRALDNLRRNCI